MSGGASSGGRPHDDHLASSLASAAIRRLELPRRERIAIAVAGESGSGKSTTAAGLGRSLTDAGYPAGVVHQDNYFIRPPRTNHDFRVQDLGNVGPHEVDLELLQSHVDAFLGGSAGTDAPLVDYPGNRFVRQRLDFSGLSVLIVDGTYVFRLRGVALRIFLEATHEETRERRRVRNRDIDAPVIDRILAIEHDIIVEQAKQADIVVDRDFVMRTR